MMKLTVAFLAALAAADAAEARSARNARRDYSYGGENYPSYPEVPAVSSAAKETPKESAAVPYVQSSAEVFETSKTPVDVVYPTPTPAAGGDYGNGYGEVPPAGGEKSSYVPSPAESSAAAYPVDGGYGKPAEPSVYSSFSQSTPAEAVKPTPSGVYPVGGEGKPSGAYPTGGYGGEVPKDATSSKPAYGTGYPAYPTGTGSNPASSTPLSDYVTKTIYSTQYFTKTACPSTVTDCPAKSTQVVTSVVPVGTTVCPESEYPEATPVKVSTSAYPVSEVTNVVTETLVYTVGVGSSAHPVTTEVVSTSTSTVYKTVVVTLGKPTPTPGAEYPVEGEGYPEGGKQTGTSTIRSTTTSTKYITVKPTPSANVPVGNEGYPTAGKNEEECAAPVTVTVTAKETVTVTKGADKPTGYPEKPSVEEKPKPSKPVDSYPEYPASSATPSAKYPIGNNGTNPYPVGPTGFKTSTKPAYPTGTGYVPTKPSETASLPYFSFVSEVPYPAETPSKEEKPYSSAPPAAETSAAYPPAGGNEYGNGYGAVPAPSSPVATPYPSEAKTPSKEESYPTPTPANQYGSGYGTY